MKYHANFDILRNLNLSVGGQNAAWGEELQATLGTIDQIIDSTAISGVAADSVKNYMNAIHKPILSSFYQLMQLHAENCNLYFDDYCTNIDTMSPSHAVIHSERLRETKDNLELWKKDALEVDNMVHTARDKIRDIAPFSQSDITAVDVCYQNAINFITELDEKIIALEACHCNNDFTATQKMIHALKVQINEQVNHARSYKTDFSTDQLISSDTFQQLQNAYMEVHEIREAQKEAVLTAIENENDRLQVIQEEYEEYQRRQAVANAINFAIFVVGAVAVVATAGMATPIAVGVAAGVGAVTAGVSNLTGQYVKHGNLIDNADKIDWGSFGADVVVGGIVGGISGGVGKGVNFAFGNVSTTGMKIVRGITAGLSSGTYKRAVGTFITTLDPVETLRETFDPLALGKDIVTGGLGDAGGDTVEAIIDMGDDWLDHMKEDSDNPYRNGEYTPPEDVKGSDEEYYLDDRGETLEKEMEERAGTGAVCGPISPENQWREPPNILKRPTADTPTFGPSDFVIDGRHTFSYAQ